jgi:hypothetical protein
MARLGLPWERASKEVSMAVRRWIGVWATAVFMVLLGLACEGEESESAAPSQQATTSPSAQDAHSSVGVDAKSESYERTIGVEERIQEIPAVVFFRTVPQVTKLIDEGRPDLAIEKLDELEKDPYAQDPVAKRVLASLRALTTQPSATRPATRPAAPAGS